MPPPLLGFLLYCVERTSTDSEDAGTVIVRKREKHMHHSSLVLFCDECGLANEGFFLIDFGIARTFLPGKAKDTTLLGSPGYAPPEQYGRSQTDQRSDIYSLGATLQTLLTGRDPLELRNQEASYEWMSGFSNYSERCSGVLNSCRTSRDVLAVLLLSCLLLFVSKQVGYVGTKKSSGHVPQCAKWSPSSCCARVLQSLSM